MNHLPSTNGANGGRGPAGRFAKGNAGGPGNPFAAKTARLRRALLAAVKPADLRAVALALLAKAKDGDVPAIKEILDRTLGKPIEPDLIERIERLERNLLDDEGNKA